MLNLAGMIDVTFLLLIYFMVTMIVAADEDRLDPALRTETESATASSNDFQPQRIDVLVLDGRPAYRIGSRVCAERDELLGILRPLPKSVGITIHVHPGVRVGFAVAALQVAHDAGFDQVTYVPTE